MKELYFVQDFRLNIFQAPYLVAYERNKWAHFLLEVHERDGKTWKNLALWRSAQEQSLDKVDLISVSAPKVVGFGQIPTSVSTIKLTATYFYCDFFAKMICFMMHDTVGVFY